MERSRIVAGLPAAPPARSRLAKNAPLCIALHVGVRDAEVETGSNRPKDKASASGAPERCLGCRQVPRASRLRTDRGTWL